MSRTITCVDLVTKSGELIRIECPVQHEDDLHDTIDAALKRGDWWSPEQFDGCKAVYLGLDLRKVNMREVVGAL